MAYTNNRFCWHGVISTDLAQTTPFYSDVLGWTSQTVPMGDEDHTFFAASDGKNRAHTRPPNMDGEPSHWNSYLRVEDVDAATDKAVANGGTCLSAPMDIPPGRFSVIASPSSAIFLLFHEADETAVNAADVEGAIHWVELHSTDLESDLAWLNASFGITSDVMEMPMGPYHLLKSGETQVGGAVTQMHEGAPSMWLPWIRLSDVDSAAAHATSGGGNVVAPPFDVPGVGRLAIVQDPTGGVVGVITPPQA